jgi:hypothetical protein
VFLRADCAAASIADRTIDATAATNTIIFTAFLSFDASLADPQLQDRAGMIEETRYGII